MSFTISRAKADADPPRSQMPDSSIIPTYRGHVTSTYDALVLIEACLNGLLCHLSRRPRRSEYSLLAKSGNIFVYEGRSSGIYCWEDGLRWSDSKTVGNFKFYRQLALDSGSGGANGLYDSKGLCKRTMTVTVRGILHHIVAYFMIRDVSSLASPCADPEVADSPPRAELLAQGFQKPIDKNDLEEILIAAES